MIISVVVHSAVIIPAVEQQRSVRGGRRASGGWRGTRTCCTSRRPFCAEHGKGGSVMHVCRNMSRKKARQTALRVSAYTTRSNPPRSRMFSTKSGSSEPQSSGSAVGGQLGKLIKGIASPSSKGEVNKQRVGLGRSWDRASRRLKR
jgi:hypothetical protein